MSSNPSGTGDLLCPNWPFSNASNVHVSKDRGWFTEYTPFKSTVGSRSFAGDGIPVIGIGTVLVLRDVLHCPSALCNLIGFSPDFLEEYNVDFRSTEQSLGTITDRNGRSVAYFAPNKILFQVQLSGPPVGPVVGPSVFKKDAIYWVNFLWSDQERARWEAYKKDGSSPVAAAPQTNKDIDKDQPDQSRTQDLDKNTNKTIESNNSSQQYSPPYTAEERQWLKTHYGNEYHFLTSFGLSLYNEADRDEGRAITLPMVKAMYGSSLNFMLAFGLKFYELDDWKKAQEIASELFAGRAN
ncbi:hypothetical protein DV735_g2352, partial [Chaetothyriales sp. CBS 134920]